MKPRKPIPSAPECRGAPPVPLSELEQARSDVRELIERVPLPVLRAVRTTMEAHALPDPPANLKGALAGLRFCGGSSS